MRTEHINASSGLSATRWPRPDAPQVVLLHGIPGHGGAWRSVAERMQRDFDVVVPDLLGFGASTRPTSFDELEAAAQARALADLLDEAGVTSAVVAGHDYGGPVALHLLRERPDLVRGVALLATNAFGDTPIPFPLSAVTWPVVGSLFGRLIFSAPSLRMMVRQGTGSGRIDPSAYLGDARQQRAIATIFGNVLLHLDRVSAPLTATLASATVPVFVGWGDRDPFFSLAQGERTASTAGVDLRVYRGAGHFLPEERSAEVADDLIRFSADAFASTGSPPR